MSKRSLNLNIKSFLHHVNLVVGAEKNGQNKNKFKLPPNDIDLDFVSALLVGLVGTKRDVP